MIWVGVDTGGTFTDLICFDSGRLRVHKVLSDSQQPERAISSGLAALGLTEAAADGKVRVVHGTTIATNAALENKGVKTLFITNRGFTDLLSIGRQARRELYSLCPQAVADPVPPELCCGLTTRVDARGVEIQALDAVELKQLIEQIDADVEAVAVCFLFSYLNNSAELAVAAALPERLFASISSRVLPEYREYERALATWLNASLGPIVSRYLLQLEQRVPAHQLAIMQSSGGTISARQAAGRAVDLLLSGPAGGLAAARALASQLDLDKVLTLDMGGTSTDVAMVDQEVRLTTEGRIGPYPVAVPMVDMHTIGAGGGSVAYLDAAGMLHVGPQSAGADPGPACYGRGGELPTVTDAHLCLGTLPAQVRLAGSLPLDVKASRRAVGALAEAMGTATIEDLASGILALANQHMVQALRVISEQRGLDPAEFALCSFGGAGALHVCDLAENLGVTRAIVPLHAGIFSALGMLLAPRLRELSQGLHRPLDGIDQTQLDAQIEELATRGREELVAEGVVPGQIKRRVSLDCRYLGQSFSLSLELNSVAALAEAFHRLHEQTYGHRLDRPIELVTLRVSLSGPAPAIELPALAGAREGRPVDHCQVWGCAEPVPCYERSDLAPDQHLQGPALVVDQSATLWLKPGWRLDVSAAGHLMLGRLEPA